MYPAYQVSGNGNECYHLSGDLEAEGVINWGLIGTFSVDFE